MSETMISSDVPAPICGSLSRWKSLLLIPILAIGAGPLSGCGRGKEALHLVPVEGFVLLDHKPVSNASVTFIPEVGPIARGVTDETGAFSLTTRKTKDGAAPGVHQVIVSKTQPAANGDIYAPPIHLIPERYSSPVSSGLVQTVPEKGVKDVSITLAR